MPYLVGRLLLFAACRLDLVVRCRISMELLQDAASSSASEQKEVARGELELLQAAAATPCPPPLLTDQSIMVRGEQRRERGAAKWRWPGSGTDDGAWEEREAIGDGDRLRRGVGGCARRRTGIGVGTHWRGRRQTEAMGTGNGVGVQRRTGTDSGAWWLA
jgi:hypothetical protein